MYILFNEDWTVSTVIPHGQVVRQGNGFDIYMCFQKKAKFSNLTPFAYFVINGTEVLKSHSDEEKLVLFTKDYINEATFGFKEGESYICYHMWIENDVTVNYGLLRANLKIVDRNGVERTSPIVINVQKTFGSADIQNVSNNTLDALLEQMKVNTHIFVYYAESEQPSIFNAGNSIVHVWKKLGFVSGSFKMVGSLSDAEEENGYAVVASFEDAPLAISPSTIFGHTEDGEDVELRVFNNGDKLTISVDIDSAIDDGDTVYIAGTYPSSEPDSEVSYSEIVEVEDTETGDILNVRILDFEEFLPSFALIGVDDSQFDDFNPEERPSGETSISSGDVIYSEDDLVQFDEELSNKLSKSAIVVLYCGNDSSSYPYLTFTKMYAVGGASIYETHCNGRTVTMQITATSITISTRVDDYISADNAVKAWVEGKGYLDGSDEENITEDLKNWVADNCPNWYRHMVTITINSKTFSFVLESIDSQPYNKNNIVAAIIRKYGSRPFIHEVVESDSSSIKIVEAKCPSDLISTISYCEYTIDLAGQSVTKTQTSGSVSSISDSMSPID